MTFGYAFLHCLDSKLDILFKKIRYIQIQSFPFKPIPNEILYINLRLNMFISGRFSEKYRNFILHLQCKLL